MTIRERLWLDVLVEGLADRLGDPRVLDADNEGESRASLMAPPPLLEVPPPPCDAVGRAAAEEASCEAD
jgi:hypothetical protein